MSNLQDRIGVLSVAEKIEMLDLLSWEAWRPKMSRFPKRSAPNSTTGLRDTSRNPSDVIPLGASPGRAV